MTSQKDYEEFLQEQRSQINAELTTPLEVQVAFMVPVEVVVNLESRTVTKVIVAADAVTMPVDLEDLPEVHEYGTFEEVTDPDVRKKAGEIADHPDVEWPAWNYS